MKRLFMLLAVALMVVAAMALSGVAQAASPSDICREKAESLTGKNLAGYFFVVDTADSNTFSPTKGRAEVFCGFDGGDHISHLNEDDIFIGGPGRDQVDGNNNGAFYGGAGNDYVGVNTGTFYGGAGDDEVGGTFNYGTFNGGADRDIVDDFNNGTFNGGDGDDQAWFNEGTFNGGKGPDKVLYNGFNTYDATYHGGDGNDYVDQNTGTFDGGDGDDSVQVNSLGGTFFGGLSNDYVDKMFSGVFDGGPGWDGIGRYLGGRTLNVDYTKSCGLPATC
jgi:hypothetical protein